ncbi:GIY-YIG nuclease family protein [Microbacterium xylanilyticum]
MAWTYIVECADGSFYTGSTDLIDVEARIWQHNNDRDVSANFTRRRRPVHLVYSEAFDRIEDAFTREKQIQGWSRAKKLALIELRGADLPELSRSRRREVASTGSVTDGGDARSLRQAQ